MKKIWTFLQSFKRKLKLSESLQRTKAGSLGGNEKKNQKNLRKKNNKIGKT